MPKVRVDNLEIQYDVVNRDIGFPRLEFRTGRLAVILPKGKDAKEIVEKHKTWIGKKHAEIIKATAKSKEKSLDLSRTVQDFKISSLRRVKLVSEKHGFSAKSVYFRKMKSKWASHSSNGNLTINTYLRFLPERLINYVIFHELVHSVERRHNERFWRIVEKGFKNHLKLENELMIYWFIIQENIPKNELT